MGIKATLPETPKGLFSSIIDANMVTLGIKDVTEIESGDVAFGMRVMALEGALIGAYISRKRADAGAPALLGRF